MTIGISFNRVLGRQYEHESSLDENQSVASMLVILIISYTVFAMIQRLIDFSMNRVIGAFIMIILLYDFMNHLSPLRIIATSLIGIISMVGITFFSTNLSEEVEFWIYWSSSLLMLCYVSRDGALDNLISACYRYRRALTLVTLSSAILMAGLLISHTGYIGGWGSSYFAGLCNTKHTMASVCCVVMTASLFCWCTGSISTIASYIVCGTASYGLLQTGARTYLVPAFIVWVFIINSTVSRKWMRVCVIALLAIVLSSVYAKSGMAEKFNYLGSIDEADSISSFSSGRVEYWKTDLIAFFAEAPIKHFIGNSASYVYDLNQYVFRMRIWSHNDFIMLLCATGWCGLVIYLLVLRSYFSRLRYYISTCPYLLIFLYIVFPAFVNGFYSYQHLLYSTIFLMCDVIVIERKQAASIDNALVAHNKKERVPYGPMNFDIDLENYSYQ